MKEKDLTCHPHSGPYPVWLTVCPSEDTENTNPGKIGKVYLKQPTVF